MKLDNQQLISEFHESIKESYPDLSYEQLKEVVFGPWRYLRDEMESGTFEPVRFRYFGVFQVYPNRAKNILKNLEDKYSKGIIDENTYLKGLEITNNNIKRLDGKNS